MNGDTQIELNTLIDEPELYHGFASLHKFSDDDWMIVTHEEGIGMRLYFGESLAAVLSKWSSRHVR